jgi:hypothetical protein
VAPIGPDGGAVNPRMDPPQSSTRGMNG